MKSLLLSLSIALLSNVSIAQTPCACCSEHHRQFDYWIGEWEVFDTLGVKIGENTITKQEGGCILAEHWRSSTGSTGRSMNYFTTTDSTWRQLWVDNQGSSLELRGKGEYGLIQMRTELQPGKKVPWYFNEITWTMQADGSVIQRWEVLDEFNNVLQVSFVDIYLKKKN